MKTKMKKQKRVPGERYQSLKVKLVSLLGDRNDVNRFKAAEILGVSPIHISMVMADLRKAGIRIFPSKGPGTPLKIVTSQRDAEKYLDWRDNRFLGTARQMVATAAEFGEEYKELATRQTVLLKTLNHATSERPALK